MDEQQVEVEFLSWMEDRPRVLDLETYRLSFGRRRGSLSVDLGELRWIVEVPPGYPEFPRDWVIVTDENLSSDQSELFVVGIRDLRQNTVNYLAAPESSNCESGEFMLRILLSYAGATDPEDRKCIMDYLCSASGKSELELRKELSQCCLTCLDSVQSSAKLTGVLDSMLQFTVRCDDYCQLLSSGRDSDSQFDAGKFQNISDVQVSYHRTQIQQEVVAAEVACVSASIAMKEVAKAGASMLASLLPPPRHSTRSGGGKGEKTDDTLPENVIQKKPKERGGWTRHLTRKHKSVSLKLRVQSEDSRQPLLSEGNVCTAFYDNTGTEDRYTAEILDPEATSIPPAQAGSGLPQSVGSSSESRSREPSGASPPPLAKTVVSKAAIRNGDILHWCSIVLKRSRSPWMLRLRLQINEFMHELAAKSVGIAIHEPLLLDVFLGMDCSAGESIDGHWHGSVRVHAFQNELRGATGVSRSMGLSYIVPHIVTQYLNEDQICRGNLFVGLSQTLVRRLAGLPSVCCVCGSSLPNSEGILVPRACDDNLCISLFNSWIQLTPFDDFSDYNFQLGPSHEEKIFARDLKKVEIEVAVRNNFPNTVESLKIMQNEVLRYENRLDTCRGSDFEYNKHNASKWDHVSYHDMVDALILIRSWRTKKTRSGKHLVHAGHRNQNRVRLPREASRYLSRCI